MSTPGPPRTATYAEFQTALNAGLAAGELDAAAELAVACRAAFPQKRAGWLLGSIAALLRGDAATGLGLIDARLVSDPHDVQCLVQRAECLLSLGRHAAAVAAADAAAQHSNGQPAALDAIGEFYVRAAEHAAALRAYDAALAMQPDDASLLGKRAVVHRFLGNFAASALDQEAVLRLAPHDAEALKGLTELSTQSPGRNQVAALQNALAREDCDPAQAAALHLGLAKAYEDLGEHTASWQHLTAGNRWERSRIHYDSGQDRAVMERIAGSFPLPEDEWPDTTGARPIFIVGLPRTGTTLVDRILGSHSQVHSAGELSALSEAIAGAVNRGAAGVPSNWLEYTAALGHTDAAFIAREYLTRSHGRRGDLPRFTDKQPVNFFYCALILRAFPAARIVHLRRYPLAACYAIYKTRFGGTYPFAYDLDELGDFYVGYHQLMAHWHRILPGRVYDVAYEDIVTALEPTTRRLLDHLELPFEPACLDFHLNPASTATASAVQVRQPLYASSLDQWRHHADALAPLRARLQSAGIDVA